jgi:SSS family solute:Na+ symporter
MPFMNRTGIVFWLCMAIGVLVSLVTRPAPEERLEGLIWNRESLRLPPEQRATLRGLRSPTLWWAIITAVVVFMYVWYR